MSSEMEEAEVGWPDLVTLTAFAESILIWFPMSSQRE